MPVADAVTLTAGATKPNLQTYAGVWPYYEVAAAARKWPRHYASPMLQCQKRDHYHLYHRSCLCILKRRQIMGRTILYLTLPPMHPTGDLTVEREVIDEFSRATIPTLLADEDVVLYGYPPQPPWVGVGGEYEYIYLAGELANVGRLGSRVRNYLNNYDRCVADGSVYTTNYKLLPPEVYDKCVAVAHLWREKRTRQYSGHLPYFITSYNQWANEYPDRYRCWVLHRADGEVLFYFVSEYTAPNKAVLTSSIRNYGVKGTVRRPLWAAMREAGKYYLNVVGPDCVLNYGAAEGGLARAKQALGPAHNLVLHRFGAHGLPMDVWKWTCQSE